MMTAQIAARSIDNFLLCILYGDKMGVPTDWVDRLSAFNAIKAV